MTILKKNWLLREPQKSKDLPYGFRDLKREIAVIRPQGEVPAKAPGTFSQYLCDLCARPHPVSDLRQCVLCGRWSCNSCWKDEFYTCKSCAGLITIHAHLNKE